MSETSRRLPTGTRRPPQVVAATLMTGDQEPLATVLAELAGPNGMVIVLAVPDPTTEGDPYRLLNAVYAKVPRRTALIAPTDAAGLVIRGLREEPFIAQMTVQSAVLVPTARQLCALLGLDELLLAEHLRSGLVLQRLSAAQRLATSAPHWQRLSA